MPAKLRLLNKGLFGSLALLDYDAPKRLILRQEVIGTAGDDVIVGGDDDDRFIGHGGNDHLVGNGGNDTLRGGDGDDLVEGGDGNDTLASGAGADELIGGSGNDIYDIRTLEVIATEMADGGIDTVLSRTSGYVLGDNFENLTLINGAYSGTGNALDNVIIGNGGSNLLHGGAGDDYIDGGVRGGERLYGDEGNDILIASATTNRSRDFLYGGTGNDVLNGGGGGDTLFGGAGADRFTYDEDPFRPAARNEIVEDFSRAEGDRLDFTLIDAIRGTAEHDGFTFIGADGFSRTAGELRFEVYDNFLLVYGDTDGNGSADFGVRLMGISELVASDILGLGSLVEEGGEGNDTFIGGSAGDQFIGHGGDDLLIGNGGNDVLRGGDGNDRIEGGDGNDTLASGSGVDQLLGGAENDTYFVTDDRASLSEAADGGTDTVFSRIGSFTLGSNFENLTLLGSGADSGTGNELANIITGNARDNDLRGGRGNDVIDGGDGADTISGGDDFDRVTGGEGDDFLTGNGANDSLDGGDGEDTIYGGDGNDNVMGSIGGDLLFGNGGDDTVQGGDGDDRMQGGAGRDVFFGGAGSDTFVFAEGDMAGLGPDTSDRIIGFLRGEDGEIDLSGVDAIAGTAEDDGFTFIRTARFSGTAGELRYTQRDAGFTMIQGDTDGDGQADFAIRIDGLVDLYGNDFVF